jgi:hypothetical protein
VIAALAVLGVVIGLTLGALAVPVLVHVAGLPAAPTAVAVLA